MRCRFTLESGKERIAYGETFESVRIGWNLATNLHKPVKKRTAIQSNQESQSFKNMKVLHFM